MLVTSLGFLVSKIPLLHFQVLGGCLCHCLSAWNLIGVSTWVRNVVSEGWKIPFKYIPHQSIAPVNPPASSVAFDIFVREAKDLQEKEAIIPVDHEP